MILIFSASQIQLQHFGPFRPSSCHHHYSDVIMSTMASQITGVSIVCTAVVSGADQRKHQSSAPVAFVRGIHRWPVNSSHKVLQRGIFFHLMTSSLVIAVLHPIFIYTVPCYNGTWMCRESTWWLWRCWYPKSPFGWHHKDCYYRGGITLHVETS